MARQREFDADRVVARAIDLFWKHGYEGTSVQDLVEATGVSRAGLYAVFGNKEGLFNAAIDRYMSGGVGRMILDAPLDEPVASLLRRVFAQIVEQGATNARPRGCMITNTAVELAEERGPAAAKVAANMLEIEADLHARIRRGQARGEIARAMDARAAARFVLNNMHGLRVMAKLFPQRETLQDIAGCVLACFAQPAAARPGDGELTGSGAQV